jgi:hypothetical protein
MSWFSNLLFQMQLVPLHPGVVFASSLGESAGVTALRNCVKVGGLYFVHVYFLLPMTKR